MFTQSDLTKAHEKLEEAYEARKEAIGRVDNTKLYNMQETIHNAFNHFIKIETYLIEQERAVDAPSTKAKRNYITKRRTLFNKNPPHDQADCHFNLSKQKKDCTPTNRRRG